MARNLLREAGPRRLARAADPVLKPLPRMEIASSCKVPAALARRLREEREALTHEWLEQIAARVELDPNRVFPSDELLDHVPLLLDGIADHLENPGDEIAADAPVVAKALELGELRYSQGFDARQILREYEILGTVLFDFLSEAVEETGETATPAELLACGQRIFRAVSAIQQVTTERYLRMAGAAVRDRENRLRSFNRTVSHELKNRIGAVLGAAQILEDPELAADPERRVRFARMVVENAHAMQGVLDTLLDLSRMEDARRHRHVTLPLVAAEAVRQLGEMARQQGVELRMAPGLPEIEVESGALELCLTNYLSNAIKYADRSKPGRWVELRAGLREQDGTRRLVVEVEDNGLGVPPEARERLFSRFYRAHAETAPEVGGHGLGLSIVRETMESLGGDAWAEFGEEGGSRFLLSLPCRREADRMAVRAAGEAEAGMVETASGG
jgi:signal transduction histidine kinase